MITEEALMQACGEGTYWDDLAQACLTIETCQEDLDGDGVIGVNDLLDLLSSFGSECAPEPRQRNGHAAIQLTTTTTITIRF